MGLALVLVGPATAEEELYAGDFVDRDTFPGVTHEIVSTQWIEHDDELVMHVRTTLQPGAAIPPSVFSDYWASTVDSGHLTVVAREGPLRGGKDGPRRVYEAGSTFQTTVDDVLSWENRGLMPAEVVSVVLFDQARDPITRVERFLRFEDLFEGDVVERFVVEGRRRYGAPYRVVVRDRSGLVLGARMATSRESGWARGKWGLDQDIGFADGHGYGVTLLMVQFYSFPCGPDAVIDVGEGLRAIKVVDRFDGGCDASSQRHDVVLKIREPDRFESEEILGLVVRPGDRRRRGRTKGLTGDTVLPLVDGPTHLVIGHGGIRTFSGRPG